jgi:hypothetical protein
MCIGIIGDANNTIIFLKNYIDALYYLILNFMKSLTIHGKNFKYLTLVLNSCYFKKMNNRSLVYIDD